MNQSVNGMIHSKNARGDFQIIDKVGDNQYIALVDGVKCTAIFNPFVGCYYADDVYGIINA